MKGKRGWIRIVEAFFAILIITGILLIIAEKNNLQDSFKSEIYDAQILILKDIQLDNALREDILNLAGLPVNWSDLPLSIKNNISNKVPEYLNCDAIICHVDDSCNLIINEDKEIYVKSVMIAAGQNKYNPRQLRLFCRVAS